MAIRLAFSRGECGRRNQSLAKHFQYIRSVDDQPSWLRKHTTPVDCRPPKASHQRHNLSTVSACSQVRRQKHAATPLFRHACDRPFDLSRIMNRQFDRLKPKPPIGQPVSCVWRIELRAIVLQASSPV